MATIRKRTWRTARGEARESWQCDFTDQAGKRRHRQFSTKKAADAFMVEARGQVERGTFAADSESPTVALAAAVWLERCERDGLERATVSGYRSHVRWHIEPILGSVKLSRLTRPRVEAFVDELLAGGRSRALVRHVLLSLKALIGEAQRRGQVATNVARDVKLPIATRHQERATIPDKAEVRALLEGTTGRKRVVLVLAALCGLRTSEIRGLRWCDVNFSKQLLTVRQRADTSGNIGSTKSASSRRDVPLPPMVASALKEWKLASGGGDLVLQGAHGPICHNTILELGGRRLHPLRHFYASWLIDQGFGPKRVQQLMGHSSIKVTFDVYGHLFPQEDDHARFAAAEHALMG